MHFRVELNIHILLLSLIPVLFSDMMDDIDTFDNPDYHNSNGRELARFRY